MKRTLLRGTVAAVMTGAALFASASPALADEPEIVDEPDTSNYHDKYTFAPLGVPVIGLIQSLSAAPGKIIPGA
ncbi:hypothetical protein [Thermocrispum municipale]|uniref:hypothetical protein n=1 Tax=Thermocrispum municipale TaxID=37926 RepID=UPI000404AC4D|nr:hypothetical protein [Thermocrispum municipale]